MSQTSGVPILTQLLSSSVILDKLINLAGPWFPYR